MLQYLYVIPNDNKSIYKFKKIDLIQFNLV